MSRCTDEKIIHLHFYILCYVNPKNNMDHYSLWLDYRHFLAVCLGRNVQNEINYEWWVNFNENIIKNYTYTYYEFSA